MNTEPAQGGALVAHNIAREMTRLDWDFEKLGEESGLGWGTVVSWRADAGDMTMQDLSTIAAALGVSTVALLDGQR